MTKAHMFGVGPWLPEDQRFLADWLAALITEVAENPKPLHPVVDDLRRSIEDDPELFMLFHLMFEQIPKKPRFRTDPTGQPQVRDYRTMLGLFDAILTRAPAFNRSGLVGFPINAILDWPMGTEGGFAAFLNATVNERLRAILNEWARFLGSADSTGFLNDDPRTGWFGADASEAMPHFDAEFVCDPSLPHRGFTSWDDFFTRRFRPGVRPIAAPSDDSVIINACESAPYRIAHNVAARDRFWIKAQPYSLEHMLGGDDFTPRFTGGTIYQAFLSPLSYHRWHSPVTGRIVKVRMVPGAYYSETPAEGFDPSAPNDSQGYITAVATRAAIFIEAANPAIGLMCVLLVGMAEVSSCDVTVYEGQRVQKGDELGMFHFGGSTHCLIFRPGVRLAFDLHGQTPGLSARNIPVNARIATVL